MPWVSAAGAAVLLVAVVGCGGAATSAPSDAPDATPTAEATPEPTPEATPEPTPTPEPTLDLSALGEAYVALATRLFEAQTEGYAMFDAAQTDDDWFEANMLLENAYRAAATDLEAMEFPPELEADQAELHELLIAIADEYQKQIDDPQYDNYDTLGALIPRMPEIGGRIREVLGLPPPVTAPPS